MGRFEAHILLTLYFSNHEPDVISARFMELLAECNVLVVENGSCDGSEELRTKLLNELSSGKLTPPQLDAYGDPQAMFKGFEQALGKLSTTRGRGSCSKIPRGVTWMVPGSLSS